MTPALLNIFMALFFFLIKRSRYLWCLKDTFQFLCPFVFEVQLKNSRDVHANLWICERVVSFTSICAAGEHMC